MMNYLVRGGHRWEDLIDSYSIGLVQNLYKAGRDQDKAEHLQTITGLSIAVVDAIDTTFGKGNAKVLQNYAKAILRKAEQVEERIEDKPKGAKVSNSVMALFNSLPKVEIAGEDNESG